MAGKKAQADLTCSLLFRERLLVTKGEGCGETAQDVARPDVCHRIEVVRVVTRS